MTQGYDEEFPERGEWWKRIDSYALEDLGTDLAKQIEKDMRAEKARAFVPGLRAAMRSLYKVALERSTIAP